MKQINEESKLVPFCLTKAGHGFKICVDGTWLYTSKKELFAVLAKKANAAQFRTWNDSKAEKKEAIEEAARKIAVEESIDESLSDLATGVLPVA